MPQISNAECSQQAEDDWIAARSQFADTSRLADFDSLLSLRAQLCAAVEAGKFRQDQADRQFEAARRRILIRWGKPDDGAI